MATCGEEDAQGIPGGKELKRLLVRENQEEWKRVFK